MNKIDIHITVHEAAHAGELTPLYRALLHEAIRALPASYAPYSQFNVGAAVLLNTADMVCGSNQENAASPAGVCAECAALYNASTRYPQAAVVAVAVVSATGGKLNSAPVYPCGRCRQVLLEYEKRAGNPIAVIMGGSAKIHIVDSVKDLLPLNFELSTL